MQKAYAGLTELNTCEAAQSEKKYWVKTRVIKIGYMDYALYQHGGRA